MSLSSYQYVAFYSISKGIMPLFCPHFLFLTIIQGLPNSNIYNSFNFVRRGVLCYICVLHISVYFIVIRYILSNINVIIDMVIFKTAYFT